MEATLSVPAEVSRLERIRTATTEAYTRHGDWITFYRELLGPEGIIRQLYPSAAEMAEFQRSQEHADIQAMLKKLRERSGDSTEDEPTRVITVRLPRALHESLKIEGHLHETSMNQLCISKLLQLIDKDLVPNG